MDGRILLFGASGLLGSSFARVLGPRAKLVARVAVSRDPLAGMEPLLRSGEFSAIINCIAHTNVEAAESDIRTSYEVNAFLPGRIARIAQKAGVQFLHFSSTGCYGDARTEPWDDFAVPAPYSQHHLSKLAGEAEVRRESPNSLILRTGWLYGVPPPGRADFIAKIKEHADGRPHMFSDPRQKGNPTCVDDVVRQSLLLLEKEESGTLNCVARGVARRIDYVRAIVAALGLPTRIEEAPEGHFIRRAPVSPNEAAINLKLELLGMEIMPEWQSALNAHVQSRYWTGEDPPA
jgi:dTDP-4-dehydrorhamnose reductase